MLTAEVSRVMPILDWCSNGVGRVLGSRVGGGLGGGWDHSGGWEGLVVGRDWWLGGAGGWEGLVEKVDTTGCSRCAQLGLSERSDHICVGFCQGESGVGGAGGVGGVGAIALGGCSERRSGVGEDGGRGGVEKRRGRRSGGGMVGREQAGRVRAFEGEECDFAAQAAGVPRQAAVRADDAVARNDERDRVVADRATDSLGGTG